MARVWLGKTRIIQSLGFGLAAAITGAILLLSWVGFGPLIRLEETFLDFRFKLRGERQIGQEVVLVAIDEKSLKEVGRWPWSRDKQARLVQAIGADGAKVIGLDIIYAEAEVTEYLRGLQEIITAANTAGAASPALREVLQQKLVMADTDRQFAKSLQAAKNVVLALPLVVPETRTMKPVAIQSITSPEYIKRSEFMLVRQAKSGEALEPHRAIDVHPPLKPFADEAVSLGHVYSLPDPDGVTRYEYLALRYDDAYFPSLALEIARVYLGVPRERMSLTLGEGVRLSDALVPADQKARMLINYAGRERTFQYVSATDVLHNRVPAGTFTGKAVIVGTAALGTYDQKTTPFSANFPGFEKNATVIENIIHRQFLEKSIWSAPLGTGMILLFGLGLGYVLPKVRALAGAALALSALVGYAAVAQFLFVKQGVWIDVVNPLLTIALTFMAVTVLRFMTEEKKAKEIRTMFSSYVSPRIVEELIKDPAKATLGGQRKELTMLFSDVVGFTTFSEKHSAEEVVAQLNEYLGAMTEVVFRWNGTLDKFVGDAIVVFWGAPLDQPDHVELAIKCSLHMRKRLGELQKKWKAEGKLPLDNGIGINTGPAVVGNIGAEGKKMDYTMIGDHVNLAARVEGLTRQFGCPIVITEYTAAHLKGMIEAEEGGDNRGRLGHVSLRKLGSVKVKGKDEPVVTYALESLKREEASRVEEEAPEETLEMTEK
ncbi:MAG: adenylate/guanylate cyclase domain-containing protein [Nitrospirae bacterium]|nr:adenylate/guanylate cyclase domain-containing protein [Nitrospirota bacterium]